MMTRWVIACATFWFGAAVLVTDSGLLAAAPIVPQVTLIALTASLLLLCRKWPALRSWLGAIPIESLVSIHVTRIVGIYFLLLFSRGELPFAFGVEGGFGDVAIAFSAPLVCLCTPWSKAGRGAYLVWNTLGLADILFVVATAARLGLQNPGSMKALTVLPLGLLPTFLVPIIICSHVVIFLRLRKSPAAEYAQAATLTRG